MQRMEVVIFILNLSLNKYLDIVGFAKKLTEQEQKGDKRASLAADDQFTQSEVNTPTSVTNEPPRAKRGKTDDNMELD